MSNQEGNFISLAQLIKGKKRKYEVKCSVIKGGWRRPTKAEELNNGFLHYQLKDGTNGLARPGTWRERTKEETN